MPLNSDILSQHVCELFVETGSYLGDGIQAAFDAGFARVWSVELGSNLHRHCATRFAPRLDRSLFLREGDSAQQLELLFREAPPALICDKPQVATFWLDAHYSYGITVQGEDETPLLRELRAISDSIQRGIISAKSTLLIDDMSGWRKSEHAFNAATLAEMLPCMNGEWTISFIDGVHSDGTIFPNDILVAKS
jgi:hypothetical protein